MRITKVTQQDFREWLEFALKLWPEYSAAEMETSLAKILASDREVGFLVKDDTGDAIGFMNLSLRYDYVPGATQSPVAYVEGIYVKDEYRNQGVGRYLIQYAEQWAREQECIELASDALLENTASYEFHTKVGFQEVERIVTFIKPLASLDIRVERAEDFAAVRTVNMAAFERENEATLVDRLRDTSSTFSFVAVLADQIVGHIFFSPVSVEGDCDENLSILGLAPLAVLPEYQRQGIGSALVQHSLKECHRLGISVVVVVGHPGYYPRFGFVPAKQKGLSCEYAVPDEVFMVLELKAGALSGCSGTVKYRAEFRDCE